VGKFIKTSVRGFLNESKNTSRKNSILITENRFQGKTIINVDIQPEYANYIQKKFKLTEWAKFINQNAKSNNIIFLYNGEDTLGMIDEYSYREWLVETGIDEEVVESAIFYDKGYAFFRYCIDNSIDEDNIVDLIKFMIRHRITDSSDIDENMWDTYMAETNHTQQDVRDLLEFAGDTVYIPELMDFLRGYSNIVLTGGGINECLKEVEIALLSLDKQYNALSKFIY
jgi:hypothetical protein